MLTSYQIGWMMYNAGLEHLMFTPDGEAGLYAWIFPVALVKNGLASNIQLQEGFLDAEDVST